MFVGPCGLFWCTIKIYRSSRCDLVIGSNAMVKTKQTRNNNSPSHLFPASDSAIVLDLHGDDSWVVVKKQKVTILVPPLPIVQKSLTPDKGKKQLQAITRNISNCQSETHDETFLEMPSAALPLGSKEVDQQSWKSAAQHSLTLEKPLRQAVRLHPENPEQVGNSRSYKVFGVLNTMKSIKQPRQLHGPGSFLSGGTLLNQRLRALNLERKLQKAGGLSRWLISLGLDQFVGIFRRKSINKFQLVNLTMKKLKDMGANAVGPRRKLMHAIECVCQPYRSEPFQVVYGI